MPRRTTSILAALALATLSGQAASQIALPPTGAKPERPEYIPPSKRTNQRQAEPSTNTNAKPAAPKSDFDPTTVEFEPIYTVNEDGTLTGPVEHFEVAALRNNPLIDEELWDFIDVLLEERYAEMELITHIYPRECIEAITVAIPRFDVSDESTRTALAEITTLINQPTGLIVWLTEQGVISADMQTMSHYIATDYTQAMMTSIKEHAPADLNELDVVSLQARFLIRQGVGEAFRGFGRLARKAIEAHPNIVENADELLKLKGDDFIDAAAKALAPLPDEQLKDLFLEAKDAE